MQGIIPQKKNQSEQIRKDKLQQLSDKISQYL